MATKILCRGCRKTWFEKNAGHCPDCGTAPHPFNSALVSQRFQNLLNDKASRALREG